MQLETGCCVPATKNILKSLLTVPMNVTLFRHALQICQIMMKLYWIKVGPQ